jgi:predicted HicB family RNase H-like nuclease
VIQHKGYVGEMHADPESGLIRGKVVNARDTITFHGATVPEAVRAFRDSVDDYLAFCEESGVAPEKPASGRFVVRIKPDVHRALVLLAQVEGRSLNSLVARHLTRVARRKAPAILLDTPSVPVPGAKGRRKGAARKN